MPPKNGGDNLGALGRSTQLAVRRIAKYLPSKLPPLWQGQLIALACTLIAAGIRLLIDPLVHDHLPVAVFYPFVLAATAWGGALSGISAVAVAIVIADYFWVPPTESFKLTTPAVIPMVAFGIFCGVAIFVLSLFRVLLEAHVEGEQRAILLSHELKHRAANLLGMVQAISAQTARGAATVAEHQALLNARLMALAQAQQFFAEDSKNSVDLRTFLEHVIEPFDSRRFLIDGPAIAVPPYLGTCCALLFHELATNATKHGALSVSSGRVVINWQADKTRVRLHWQERDGPPVGMPARSGFGSRLLKTAFPPEHGEATIVFNPEGVDCKISFALI